MEGIADQLPSQPDLIKFQKQRVEATSEFLSLCDRTSNGYDSGYYWEDVQRAYGLRQDWKSGRIEEK